MEELLLPLLACWLLADLLSGFFHWVEERYGVPGIHPLLDKYVVGPNMAHHRFPAGITKGTHVETNRVSTVITLAVLVIGFLLGGRRWELAAILLFLSHSNQVHKWAHCAKAPLPVRFLQSVGLFQSVAQHALHHRNPYLTNYCVLSDWLNPTLDGLGVWTFLEKALALAGLKPLRGQS